MSITSDREDRLLSCISRFKVSTADQAERVKDLTKNQLRLVASNNELALENKKLRETLLTTQDSLSQLNHHGIEQWSKDKANDAYNYIDEALSTTSQPESQPESVVLNNQTTQKHTCRYSRSMQSYPRKCLDCNEAETHGIGE